MRDSRHVRLVGALLCLLLLVGSRGAEAQFRPRIVNGNHTQLFPTTGALLVNLGGQLTSVCSGTLIGCNAFVTAAHCVCSGATTCSPNPSSYRVFLQHGPIYSVSKVTVHPSYEFGEHNDVAIITLSSPVIGISPTAINSIGSPPNGTTGIISGFGLSRGTSDDGGIKRAGAVVTTSCDGQVPQSWHVCWHFEKPLGLEGNNSNTCSGDSGGPLFVDYGGGQLLAGITSGGFSEACMPTDLSFDTDVFANSAFIAANADLSNTACGTISQVGDSATEIIVAGSAALTRATQRCRREIGKQVANYTRSKLRSSQSCFNDVGSGDLVGACPDSSTAIKLQRAINRVDVARIADKCSPRITAASLFGGACAGVTEAGELRGCLLATVDTAVGLMLNREYADDNPSGPLLSDRARCQKQIANATGDYAAGRLRALTTCRDSLDKGRVGSCPDSRTQTKLAKLGDAVPMDIERMCTDELIAGLDAEDGFGGSCAGAASIAELAACQIAEHDTQIDGVLGIVKEVQTLELASFEVAPGKDRLRVTLNGVDDGFNDVDLYVGFGAPPTTTSFAAKSDYGGTFEAVEVLSPAAGTWHVLVHDYAGTDPGFQLTITTFEP